METKVGVALAQERGPNYNFLSMEVLLLGFWKEKNIVCKIQNDDKI